MLYADPTRTVHPALVNGAAGVVVDGGDRPVAVSAFTVAGGRIVAIEAIADPVRVAALDLDFLAR